MPFLNVRDDLELFYTDEGEGEVPLLFVHGWTCDSNDWNWQLDYFTQSNRVLAVDLRGHGASTVMADGYEPRVFAEDISLLLGKLRIAKVVGIGHSLGALVVSALAVKYPDLVNGVAAIEPSYGYGPADAARMIAAAEEMNEQTAMGVTSAMFGHAYGPHMPGFFKTWHRRRMLAMQPHVIAGSYRTNWLGPIQFGTRAETEEYLAGRTCPSLTIYTRGHWDIAAWATALGRAGVDQVTYLELGHWPHQEAPDLINSRIGTWLQGLPGQVVKDRT